MTEYFYRPENILHAKFNLAGRSNTGYAVTAHAVDDFRDITLALRTPDNRLMICAGMNFYLLPFASGTAHQLFEKNYTGQGGPTRQSSFRFSVFDEQSPHHETGKVFYGRVLGPGNETGYIETPDGARTALTPVDDDTLDCIRRDIVAGDIVLLNLPVVRDITQAFDAHGETLLLSQDLIGTGGTRLFAARDGSLRELKITGRDYYLDGGTTFLHTDEGTLFIPRQNMEPNTRYGWDSTPSWKGQTVKCVDSKAIGRTFDQKNPDIRGIRRMVNPSAQ